MGRLTTYRYALPIGVVAVAVQLLFLAPHFTGFDRLALPLVGGVLCALTAVVWLRGPVTVVDHGVMLSVNAYVVGRLAFTLAVPDLPSRGVVLGNGVPWVLLLLLMNDWILNRRAARHLNMTVLFSMALCVLAWWPAGQPGAEQEALRGMLVQLLMACATLLIVQSAMAGHTAALGRHAQQAVRDANIDILTGLPNRRALTHHLDTQAARGGNMLAVALIDVDHFKTVNDTHGHGRGDDVLRAVAQALRGQVGTRGVLGRYGGEEFLCVLDVPDDHSARQVCEELRARVAGVPLTGLPVTVSVGLAVCAAPIHPLHLLESADAALYRAKMLGRNRVNVTVLVGATPVAAPPGWADGARGSGQYA